MDTCVCVAESLPCPPETITALLIGSTPIQNKIKKKKKELQITQAESNRAKDGTWGVF